MWNTSTFVHMLVNSGNLWGNRCLLQEKTWQIFCHLDAVWFSRSLPHSQGFYFCSRISISSIQKKIIILITSLPMHPPFHTEMEWTLMLVQGRTQKTILKFICKTSSLSNWLEIDVCFRLKTPMELGLMNASGKSWTNDSEINPYFSPIAWSLIPQNCPQSHRLCLLQINRLDSETSMIAVCKMYRPFRRWWF